MKLPPHFLDLVADAALKSFWRHEALKRFARRAGVSEALLAQFGREDTKRTWFERTIGTLEASDAGTAVIQQLAKALVEQRSFPDLENWEDSVLKISAAKLAVEALRQYVAEKEQAKEDAREVKSRRKASEEKRVESLQTTQRLDQLQSRLAALTEKLGTQQAGYAFQDWFFDLMDFFDVDGRRPYVHDGRQIDGSVTIDGTTYLVETKFTQGQAAATDVDTFFKKVNGKADNTMGIFVSISGFSSVALKDASFAKTPLLLLDHTHVYLVLRGVLDFKQVVMRVRRHASQTGEAYLSASDFGG